MYVIVLWNIAILPIAYSESHNCNTTVHPMFKRFFFSLKLPTSLYRPTVVSQRAPRSIKAPAPRNLINHRNGMVRIFGEINPRIPNISPDQWPRTSLRRRCLPLWLIFDRPLKLESRCDLYPSQESRSTEYFGGLLKIDKPCIIEYFPDNKLADVMLIVPSSMMSEGLTLGRVFVR